jgi:hypothetical protein
MQVRRPFSKSKIAAGMATVKQTGRPRSDSKSSTRSPGSGRSSTQPTKPPTSQKLKSKSKPLVPDKGVKKKRDMNRHRNEFISSSSDESEYDEDGFRLPSKRRRSKQVQTESPMATEVYNSYGCLINEEQPTICNQKGECQVQNSK